MMDISVSGGASGAGAASAAGIGRQTGNGGDADAGGFSDVLNKASGGKHDSAEQPAVGQHAGDGTNGSVSAAPRHANTKALIDLGSASLAAQAEMKEKTSGSAEKETKKAERDPKAKGKHADDADLQDLSDKLDDDAMAHSAKGTKLTKAEGAGIEKGAEDDSGLSDVLSLLKQAPTDGTAAAAAFAAMAAVSQQADGKVSTDPKEKSVAGIKPKDETSPDAALAGVDARVDAQLPGTVVAGDTDATTFRLSRADGRGQSMDMHLGIDKDATGESGGKASIESVSVLDSRRYIGLAQNTNSAAVTAAISGDQEWAHAMQASSALSNAAEWTSTGKVVNTLKIQMNPIDLGLVTATMRLHGDALNVDLKVESGAAYRQLKEDHGKIIEALRSQGYAIDNVTISMAPVDRSDAGNQANAQSQQQGQASAQQGQGGEARERQNQSGQRTGGGFNGSGESGVESTSPGAAGSGRTGDVYL
ncbi:MULTISPECIES: flagellar hook-length control protein FliK [Rhizobium]|uniref:Chemotaxis protein motD Motility protein D n=1 Tax=Rhizobium favelukesii TaxID=348824 RepID=W6RCV9_9HYPH|nr:MULTISPECIES: flagellar hook-length control protein FliK [Rhizobium]MCS0457361.1 flagellar hook-length control protein FliK [Rhizobium favelukesii]UFS81847.1 flagellar hook-length control protein FliK [Rhizobium sp. T136]CDM56493.1 Chemotaxis protein motD Motility protein D [Rhizobium favelukesii]